MARRYNWGMVLYGLSDARRWAERTAIAAVAVALHIGPGCGVEIDAGGDAAVGRTESARIGSINQAVKAMMADLERTIAQLPTEGSRVRSVTLAGMDNRTGLDGAAFAGYEAELRQAFFGFDQFGLFAEGATGGGGDGGAVNTLRVSVITMDAGQWLVHGELTGVDHRGVRAVVWTGSGLVQAP